MILHVPYIHTCVIALISHRVLKKELAAAQENDIELVRLKSSPSSLVFRDMPLPMSDSTIVCDVSTDVPHPYVPPSFRCAMLDSLHGGRQFHR